MPRLYGERAEADARIDISVVGLIDAKRLAVAHHRRKWAAGADHGPALGPGEQVKRRRLAQQRRVRQRENHRPFGMSRHGGDDIAGESTRLTRTADQHGGASIGDDLGKADAVRVREIPIRKIRAFLQERRLEWLDARHTFYQHTVVDDHEEATARPGGSACAPRLRTSRLPPSPAG